MIIYLQGSDSFLAKEAIGKITDRYQKDHPDNLELRDISASDQFNFADLWATPMLSSHRLFVLRRVGDLTSSDQSSLAKYLADLPSSTVVVIWDDTKPQQSLEQQLLVGKRIIVAPLEGEKLSSWLRTTARNLGLELTVPENRRLINRFGNNLWGLRSELELMLLDDDYRMDWEPVRRPGSFFSIVRSKAWIELRRELIGRWKAGEPVELTIGSLAASCRTQTKDEDRLWLTEQLATADLAVKTGLMEPATAISHLAGRIATRGQATLQWHLLWGEIISG